jgi:hypothetical protein
MKLPRGPPDPRAGRRAQGQTFERSGRTPFVYLTLLRTWPNFDIIRQQIRIDALNGSGVQA